jgi:uncharacterized iron-regulated membrane protein
MLFSLASGVYLWWPLKRTGIRGRWHDRGFWFDLHNAIGVFSLLPLLVVAVTATIIGFENQAESLIEKITGSGALPARQRIALQTRAPNARAPNATPITPDEAVAIARAEMPGAIPYRVQMPRFGGVYQVALVYEQDRVMGARNSVAIDPHSGNVIVSQRSRDSSVAARLLATNTAIHTGNVLGMAAAPSLQWLADVAAPNQDRVG